MTPLVERRIFMHSNCSRFRVRTGRGKGDQTSKRKTHCQQWDTGIYKACRRQLPNFLSLCTHTKKGNQSKEMMAGERITCNPKAEFSLDYTPAKYQRALFPPPTTSYFVRSSRKGCINQENTEQTNAKSSKNAFFLKAERRQLTHFKGIRHK